VLISSLIRNDELTAAFARPELLAEADQLVPRCSELLSARNLEGKLLMKHGLLVKMELSKKIVYLSVAIGLLVCVVGGMLTGFLTNSAEIGIECAVPLFTMIQVLEVLVI
jgi:hypothetical protein